MTRRKKRKKQQKRQKTSQKQKIKNNSVTPSKTKKYLSVLVWFLLGISGVLFALHPRYSITVDERFNPYNPFKNPLIIINNGYLPLEITYSISASNFMDIFGNTYEKNVISGLKIKSLKADRSTPIEIHRLFNVDINNFVVSSLNLKIDVEAKTKLFWNLKYPYSKKEIIPFKLKRSHDGKYVWQEYSKN